MRSRKVSMVETPKPRTHLLSRFIMTTFIVLVILYVAGFVMVRTAGFASFVEERLEMDLGMPVRVAQTRAAWNLDLIVEGIESVPPGEKLSEPGIVCDQAVMRWTLKGLIRPDLPPVHRVELEGLRIAFVPDAEGGWAPAALSGIADWLAGHLGVRIEQPQPQSEKDPAGKGGGKLRSRKDREARHYEKMSARLRDAAVEWKDEEGDVMAGADGINLDVTPVEFPNRTMRHFLLQIAGLRTGDGSSGTDLHLELLQTEGQALILGFQVERRGAASTGGGTAKAVPGPTSNEEVTEFIRDSLQDALDP